MSATMRKPAQLVVLTLVGAGCLYLAVQIFNPAPESSQSKAIYMYRNVQTDGLPAINKDILKFQNESENWMAALRLKYGPVRYSGISAVDTTLTPEERDRVIRCIATSKKDYAYSNSHFWGKPEHIRTNNHTYLKREDAVLIEIGGNQGDDASRFVELFNPRYLILEPLEEYANILKKKFTNNPRVTVVNLGLGEKTEVIMVNIEGNNACATSKFSGKGGETPLYVVNATEFLMKVGLGIFDADLITMNCEGCEFETLETILSTTLVNHFRNIQFATHHTIPVPDAVKRYCRIQQLLARTHRPIYHYQLLWESWRRKDVP